MTHEQIAAEIVAYLFTSYGRVPKADRLVLWDDTLKREIAGWGEGPAADAIAAILRRNYEPSEQAGEGELRRALSRLIGYALTCEAKNQKRWMIGLGECINYAAEVLGDEDRCEFTGTGFRILRNAALNPKGPTP